VNAGGLSIITQGADRVVKNLDKLAKNAPHSADAYCGGMAAVYERGMKRRAPRGRTGGLVNSIKSERLGEGSWRVGTSKKYAGFVEYGTGLFATYPGSEKHRIVPIHGNVLAWTSYQGKGLKNSTSIVVTSTAGMKAQPYARPTLHEDKAAAQRGGELAAKLSLAKGLVK